MKKTQRGFDYHKFEDGNGVECSLQKSSAAMRDMIWLGANKIELKEFVAHGKPQAWRDHNYIDEDTLEHHWSANTRMHLTREQVAELLPALTKFAETGELT